MANEDTNFEELNEYSELEEKDLKAISGGCGTSTPEPEPEPSPAPGCSCPSGGLHTPSGGTIVFGEKVVSKCGKCASTIEFDDPSGQWKTRQDGQKSF